MKKYDYLIVGSGLFGSIFAYEANKRGKKCLVIDKRNHIGGNIYCENKVTNSVAFLSIDDKTSMWGDYLLDFYHRHQRKNLLKEITDNGFNIVKESSNLLEYYKECYKVIV